MRITDILVHEPLGLVRIQTDAGIEGLCDGASEEAARVIPAIYGPVLIGRDPLDREWIWQRLHNFDRERYVTENRIRDELRRVTRRRDAIAPEQPVRASEDGAPQLRRLVDDEA